MSALQVLARFAQRTATPHEVMRALVSHEQWFVPLGFAPSLGRSEFDRIVSLGKNGAPPPGELYLFTDESCLDLVAKEPLGGFVHPVTGLELFCALDEAWVKVKVNPGGPIEHFWFIAKDAIPLARRWGQALRLEALLADPQRSRAGLFAALRSFDGFSVLAHANGGVATAVGMEGFRNPAMVFTSPDSLERMAAHAPGTDAVHLDATQLFELLPRAGVDGLVFNPMGPGPCVGFPLSVGNSIFQRS